MIKVVPFEGLLRYKVSSQRPGIEPYLVDLTEYWGTGKCDCDHFKFRLEKELIVKPLHPEQYRCVHIKAARNHLADELIDTLVRQSEKKPAHRPKMTGIIQFRAKQITNG